MKDSIAAVLAAIVVLLFGAIVIFAAVAGWNAADRFATLKELLLFLNPIVGIVMGHYFTKQVLESRAETAEQRAGEAIQGAAKAEAEGATARHYLEGARADLESIARDLDAHSSNVRDAPGDRQEFQIAHQKVRELQKRLADWNDS